jgi:hypothetical protein
MRADQVWRATMEALVEAVARRKPFFTSDDVFEAFVLSGSTARTRDRRAFRPIMMRAAKAGICRKAALPPVNSRRASLHASPRGVWESLVYAGGLNAKYF